MGRREQGDGPGRAETMGEARADEVGDAGGEQEARRSEEGVRGENDGEVDWWRKPKIERDSNESLK